MAHVKRIEIRWRDMDAFGHVNNAAYLTYLEEARDEMFHRMLDPQTVHRIVIRRVEVDFLTELTQDDDMVDVAVRVERIGQSSIVTREAVTALSDGRTAAQGRTVLVHTEPGRRASSPLAEAARAALGAGA
jgi:acyl-CoA thioester hydrolase